MTQMNWLRKLVARPSSSRTAHSRATARPGRLRLECLEDRTLLTTGLGTGLLDPNFGSGGTVLTPAGPAGAELHAVAVQADGKIVAAGVASDGTHKDFAVARFNTNGTLDTSFHQTGIVLTPFGTGDSSASGIAVQADGKIVVVGDDGSNFAVARYKADGSLDTTFHHTGTLTTAFAGGVAFANGVAVQADGKIVVVGHAQGGPGGAAQDDFAVARYNSDGSLDTSFHHSGQVTTDFLPQGSDAAAVAVTPDGHIVVVGSAANGAGSSFAVAEYNADGSLNQAFRHHGGFTQNFGPLARATSVQVQADGKILVAGTAGGQFVVARYKADGTPDNSYGDEGEAVASFGGYAVPTGMALRPGGGTVLAGTVFTGDAQQLEFALAGFDANGKPDASVGAGGETTTPFAGDASASGVAVQANGDIVVAGSSGGDFALARYVPVTPPPAKFVTSTFLSSSTASAVFGQKVTLTANVNALWSGEVPPPQGWDNLSGTVTFRDGDRVLGTVSLTGSAGAFSAQLTTTLAVGTHLNITATYSGGGSFAGSTSAPISEQVRPATTTTTLTASANPSPFGQQVTYTAHVAIAAPGTGTPPGLVLFLDGASVMGVGRLNGGTATLTTRRTLGPGMHHIVAVYVGSQDYTGSMSAALTQRVQEATDTMLSLPTKPVVFGAVVTLTARVKVDGPGGVKPTGMVTFKDGTKTLGTAQVLAGGVATLTLTGGLAVGPHSITAVYSGDSNLELSTSGPGTLSVVPEVIVPLGGKPAAAWR